jgi:hypothetical protein
METDTLDFISDPIGMLYRIIYTTGIEKWITDRKEVYSDEKTIELLEYAIKHFEKNNEFEKCGYLLKGIRSLKPNDWHQNEL